MNHVSHPELKHKIPAEITNHVTLKLIQLISRWNHLILGSDRGVCCRRPSRHVWTQTHGPFGHKPARVTVWTAQTRPHRLIWSRADWDEMKMSATHPPTVWRSENPRPAPPPPWLTDNRPQSARCSRPTRGCPSLPDLQIDCYAL